MARPRTFDEERVLDAAMRAFWANGYEATSTRDLCDAVGLDRSSVYNAFTSKHELFKRALIRYIDTMTTAQLEILEDRGRPATERIRALFAKIINDESENRRNGRGFGCLTVNTTVELAGRDAEITRLLDRDMTRRLESFRAVIEAGQRDGDIASTRDPDALARFVNTVIAGIRVAAQGGADRAALESVAETALDALTH
ncbi:TetR/AcrR family transcriptional regulator [Streptosporangium sp. NBC_01639]|uniref:TetR/AcrR family transcriptional regulator n=1 Tax=unclassified Streptosporangium TaxID=2632669 RepID=UPI002DDA07C0|nr:TetR/AcrR family transcriptional regulator [Streptosporangium sp. NBC_01756]WSC88187.1 TetR/AcrR family transcriptional regulator [Streptosporangium sp. NBC_01756]WTD53135.1 TetR/AcrR family transcriptional regulator [Streptosporangium sp. NBC_01639]